MNDTANAVNESRLAAPSLSGCSWNTAFACGTFAAFTALLYRYGNKSSQTDILVAFPGRFCALVIEFFFSGAVQLIFIGILGEYIGSIHTQVLHRPHVIEKERINFENRGSTRIEKKRQLLGGGSVAR